MRKGRVSGPFFVICHPSSWTRTFLTGCRGYSICIVKDPGPVGPRSRLALRLAGMTMEGVCREEFQAFQQLEISPSVILDKGDAAGRRSGLYAYFALKMRLYF
ncbi:hypothetical protein ROS1_40210 [Roseibium sp. ROS1]